MANTFTLSGTLKDGQNNVLVGKYVRFRVTSVGTDVEDGVVYPRQSFDFKSDASGELQGESGTNTVWINGDSGVLCYYAITMPDGQVVEVVIPSTVEGTTVGLEDIIELYQVDDNTQQSSVLGLATAYTDVLANDPVDNTSFNASNWQAALEIDDFTALTPDNERIIKGNGTAFVLATNFRVDAGANGTGTEMGLCTADGNFARSSGFASIASASYSISEGLNSSSTADHAIASGRRSKAIHQGSRVESDSQNADVSSTTTDQYTARFQNGYVFKGGDAIFEGNVTFSGGIQSSTTSVTSTTYTALVTDSIILVDDDTAGSTVTITLPVAATAGDGFAVTIKKLGSTASVIIDGDGAETIDGDTTNTISTIKDWRRVVSDGSNWFIIG